MFSRESQLENTFLCHDCIRILGLKVDQPQENSKVGRFKLKYPNRWCFSKRHLLIDGLEFTTTPAATATATTDFTLPFICIILEHVMLRRLLLKTRFFTKRVVAAFLYDIFALPGQLCEELDG